MKRMIRDRTFEANDRKTSHVPLVDPGKSSRFVNATQTWTRSTIQTNMSQIFLPAQVFSVTEDCRRHAGASVLTDNRQPVNEN
jgi:hypothetical protein